MRHRCAHIEDAAQRNMSPMFTPLIGDAHCPSMSPMYNNIGDTDKLKCVTYVEPIISDTFCPPASPMYKSIDDVNVLKCITDE